MKNIFTINLSLLFSLLATIGFAQKKITVLGSSTAAGTGASVPDSSWVGRLQANFRKNTSDGVDTAINNRAVGGYVTYKSLPTGYPIPAGRPDPDPNANVTYVLNDLPRANIVIINYPSNDIVSGYNPKEMMDNLRVMFQQLNENGITCYITTSQPRNTTSSDQRILLRQVVDSIQNTFGNYAINFWDDLVTSDGLYMLRAEVDADGTHPNNYGHSLLFQRVADKNIFSVGASLPLTLRNWEAQLKSHSVLLNWSTAYEESSTSFEVQRSDNGKDFQTIYQRNGTGNDASYSWTDASPLNGKNFYRLKISEQAKTIYSRIIPIINDKNSLFASISTDANQLHLQLNGNGNQSAVLTIIDYSGAILKKQSVDLRGSNTSITIPVSQLAAGNYFLRITTSKQLTAVERFSILK